MIFTVLLGVILALGIGLVLKFWGDRPKLSHSPGNVPQITWPEFAIAAAIITVLIVPLTTKAGFAMAKANKLSYEEYWNGWETHALVSREACARDSGCMYDYDCDPYTVFHTHTRPSADGKSTDTYTETHTEYHSCPYGTQETSFLIKTTLGDYDIGTTIPEGPQYRYRGKDIPKNIPRGIPVFWAECKARLDVNDPGPVTVRKTYDNYILASDTTILKQYSDRIAEFKKAKLLPKVQTDIHTFYLANKAQFVGFTPIAPEGWQLALGRLNAALGTQLQGDLHLVVVQSPQVDQNPDGYMAALKAYWTDSKEFKDQAISKNSIIVALGTDGSKITWARALTGMPLGNEALITAIKDQLPGKALTPEEVIGKVQGTLPTGAKVIKSKDINTVVHYGTLAKLIFDPATRFSRVSMTADDKDDFGTGFKYLSSQIQPSGWAKFWMIFIALIFSCGAWIACLFYTSKR